MLFLKFSTALLAPIAALAVPIGSGTDGKPQNLITIPGQSMPLPPTTQTDLPSTASHDRRQTDDGSIDLSFCVGQSITNVPINDPRCHPNTDGGNGV